MGKRSRKVNKPYLRLIYDNSRNIDDAYIFKSDIRAGVDCIGFQLTAEAREFLKITYSKPLRDASSELTPKRNSRLSQILQGHEAFKGQDDNKILSLAYYLVMEDRNPLSRFPKWQRTHSHPYGKDIISQRSSELLGHITENAKQRFFSLQAIRRGELNSYEQEAQGNPCASLI